MISFERKVALITGAGTGIGLATAAMMAAHGASVVLVDIDRAALGRAVEVIGVPADRILSIPADVSDADACERALAVTAERFGGLDFLVHCAGIYPEATIANTTDDAWRRLMNINLDGTFFLCRAAQSRLREGGAVVLLASLAAHRGSYAHAAYAATKGAILSFSRSLALELAPRVRVNTVSPGIIETAMTRDLIGQKGEQLLASTPLGRYGTAEDIAGTIAFLCSPLAAFATGETLQVNGGLYLS